MNIRKWTKRALYTLTAIATMAAYGCSDPDTVTLRVDREYGSVVEDKTNLAESPSGIFNNETIKFEPTLGLEATVIDYSNGINSEFMGNQYNINIEGNAGYLKTLEDAISEGTEFTVYGRDFRYPNMGKARSLSYYNIKIK